MKRLDRRDLLGALAVSSGCASLIGQSLASLQDSTQDSGTFTSGTWNETTARVVYTVGGELRSVTNANEVTSHSAAGVDVLGPVEPGFSGSDYHVPIVDGNSTLQLVARDGTQTGLDVKGTKPPRGQKSLLATATWNGYSLSVYYPGSNASKLFQVRPDGNPKRVAKPGNGIKAALGAGDLNGDGVDEFAFVDGSETVRYSVPGGKNTSQDIHSTGKSPGSNNNFGVGSPVTIEGYGVVVPAVNGSGGLGLLDTDGWAEKSLTSGSTAKKTPVFGTDFDNDGATELMFAGYSNGYLKILKGVGTTNEIQQVTDSTDDPIPVDTGRGVR